MANLVRDLAGYNRVIVLSNSDIITFTGQYASNVSNTDLALLQQHGSGEFVVGVQGEVGNGGVSPSASAANTAAISAANTAVTSNQTSPNND